MSRQTIRQLGPDDAEAYRGLRLQSLHDHPEAFGASWEDEASRPVSWFAARLEGGAVFGGWSEDGILLGVAGVFVHQAPKLRHTAVLWGMFIRLEARGTGLGLKLVGRVLDHVGGRTEEVRLQVSTTNVAAIRLYRRAGFRACGTELRAAKVGAVYVDTLLMAYRL